MGYLKNFLLSCFTVLAIVMMLKYVWYNPNDLVNSVYNASANENSNSWSFSESRIKETHNSSIYSKFNLSKIFSDNLIKQVRQVCAAKVIPYSKGVEAIIIGTKYKVVYCSVPKVGSTTLKADFLQTDFDIKVGPNVNDVIIHTLMETSAKLFKYEDFLKENTTDSYKFFFVRHPLERIVSTFKDKAENRDTNPKASIWYKNIWNNVIKNYRKSGRISNEITFSEFVRHILDISPNKHDPHWRSISATCVPCIIKYDFIGKIETFQRDRSYVLHKIGAKELNKDSRWLNQNQYNTSANQNENRFRPYFTQLTKKQVWRLFEIYKLDFLMFNYSIEPYLSFAKP